MYDAKYQIFTFSFLWNQAKLTLSPLSSYNKKGDDLISHPLIYKKFFYSRKRAAILALSSGLRPSTHSVASLFAERTAVEVRLWTHFEFDFCAFDEVAVLDEILVPVLSVDLHF